MCLVGAYKMECNAWNQKKIIGSRMEDFKENDWAQIFYDDISVENGYDGEKSIPSQIRGFKL